VAGLNIRFSCLDGEHEREAFDCGAPELNAFLKYQATQYIRRGLCAVHVFSDGNTVIGYYTLSSLSIEPTELSDNVAKRYPKMSIPCWLLGRLAVDIRFKGQGYGAQLLMAAFTKVLELEQQAGGYCLIVDAKNENIKPFYLKFGFIPVMDDELRLYIPLSSIRKINSDKSCKSVSS
jgi:predicted GNAT family N-acyltransferase